MMKCITRVSGVHKSVNAGSRNAQSKLGESDARRILASSEDAKSLAWRYGVSPAAVRNIRARRTWKHVQRGDLTLVLPDIHMPYHLPHELETYLDFGESIHPNRVVLIGDVIDAMTVSRFDKNPARKTTLAGEIEVVQSFLSDLRKRFPTADIHYCEGNHEDRLRKYLWRKAPELSDIHGLTIPDLLDLERFRIQWHSPFNNLVVVGLTYTHSNRIRRIAGHTARALSDELSASVICGHSHRQGWCPRTTFGGMYDAYEVGCLCDYRLLDYVDNVPNWQVGGATVEAFPGGGFHVDFARFLPDGSLVWRGDVMGTCK